MSNETRNVGRACLRHGRVLALALVLTAVTACSGDGDGSVGIGTGQDPDPVAPDFPIAYTKGPLNDEDDQLQVNTDLREILRFAVGTDLYIRDRASPTAQERNITRRFTEGEGDVSGVEISSDGRKVLFAMRGPVDPGLDLDDEDQPKWNIWEYVIATDTLRRLIVSDLTAQQGHDLSPHYLPDGRIIFASTRQQTAKAILINDGKPQYDARDEDREEPAFVLHVMRDDGRDEFKQVSFNQSSDYEPTVLDNGKVLFSRWDHAGSVNGIHLYQMNPDGTELELLYGAESHLTGTNNGAVQFVSAREMLDGRVMAILRPFDHPELGGAITIIDTQTYVENTQPVVSSAGMSGPAQTAATPNQVRTDLAPSPGGRFSSAFPLWDGTSRVLTTWAICRLEEPDPADPAGVIFVPCTPERLAATNPAPVVAPPLYGVWMYDPTTQTQQPIVIGEEGVLVSDIVAAQPRRTPTSIPDKLPGVDFDAELAAEEAGIINIRSVYDLDGVAAVNIAAVADPVVTPPANRPARFLRIEKAVAIPDEDTVDLDDTAFGPSIQQGMREVIGYAPIEPDGSVRIKVPANVALALSVLDGNSRRISARHQNWIQVVPGQELTCNGCHVPTGNLSHGRSNAFNAAYAGAAATGVAFPNSVSTFSPDAGETMAETRTRVSCQTDCAALEPTVDVLYTDVWTDPAVATPSAPISYLYSNLETIAPTNVNCIGNWTPRCRVVINYETHLHPLWNAPRPVLDGMGNQIGSNSCAQSGCHAPVNAMNAAMVPAGQLDLTDGISGDEADHFNSYRELLFADNRQILVGGAIQDEQVQIGVDAMGNPVLENVSLAPPMTPAGARQSRFFSCFDAGGTGCASRSHVGYMSPDELRLVAEWLDIGAQYYNNPFDVPVM
jgi:Hydrazine synthase alpha subunit middle domain/WD40-like Beta Propeller Repeat